VARWEGYLAEDRATAMDKIGDGYLTVQHRDHPEKAAPSPRWARTSPASAESTPRRRRRRGGQMAVLAATDAGRRRRRARKQALATYAAMVGAIVSRAVDDEALSLEVLQAVRDSLPG
jgi:TetR/AcrR family transcriptional repressor of nem operon